MNKKEKSNHKDAGKQNYASNKMNTTENSKKNNAKNLPWWVELLFVQIGLPDKLLIKILQSKKRAKELIKNDNKSLITFLFLFITLVYFYPVIKQAKNKLDCEVIAQNYIIRKKKYNWN